MLSARRRALLAALGALPLAGCGALFRPAAGTAIAPGKPATGEAAWARIAWRYVENNSDYDTGLVAGQDRTSVFTVWNLADALAAIVAAHELGIIEAREFDLRLSRVLGFLGAMDLSDGKLPNKAYDARTAKMVGFDGQPADIGWSATDVGRLLLWLRIVRERHPAYAEYVDKAVLRWTFCDAIDDCGTLYGTARTGGALQRYQEGRLGYEQLAAAGFAAWGFDTRTAASWNNAQVVNVEGVPVRHDARDPRTSGAPDAVLTMPYVLFGIELGWRAPGGDAAVQPLAQAVFRAQEERWRRDGQLTARSDYQTRQAPYVVLDSVYASGYPWNTVAADGRAYPQLAMVSNRAAFGMWALSQGDYTQRLLASLESLHDPDRGWYEGRLESGGIQSNITLATNAAVLEALLYRKKGALFVPRQAEGVFERQMQDVFRRGQRCLPAERAACNRS